MQNCKRLNRSGFTRVNRPGTAYEVSVLEPANRDVLSSTISLKSTIFNQKPALLNSNLTTKEKKLFKLSDRTGVFYVEAIIQLRVPTKIY